MAIKRPKPEEIVVKLRQVEVLMGQGMPRIDAIRQISVLQKKTPTLLQGPWFFNYAARYRVWVKQIR